MKWAHNAHPFLTLVPALALGLAPALALAQSLPAVLTIEGDVTCIYPTFTDHQISSDRLSLELPDEDGPVAGEGSYTQTGTAPPAGYTIGGPSRVAGRVEDDAWLVITFRDWFYMGETIMQHMPSPYVPTEATPLEIPLEPGATATLSYQNVPMTHGVSCSGGYTWRLDF